MDSAPSTVVTFAPRLTLAKVEEESTSIEDPEDEWSSLETYENLIYKKKLLYNKGLYSPGSGEICTKYISISASSVFRHLYFNYPAVLDPGITEALLLPEKPRMYPIDGQEQYLAVCKEMKQCPVSLFYKGLLTDKIDLKYYCVDPYGVRAMAMALESNMTVKVLNLTDSFLVNDSCYHLGQMLTTNTTLEELNLSGCKIGPVGMQYLMAGLEQNSTLISLNVSGNELGDDGVTHLASAIFRGISIEEIYLSRNEIASNGANNLAVALETHNKFRVIDLSFNCFTAPAATGFYNLLLQLAEAEQLQVLDLSWNSLSDPKIGTALSTIMLLPNLCYLNLDHNRFETEAITNLLANIARAKNLDTLILSNNPLTLDDAVLVLSKLRHPRVRVQNLIMNNIQVDQRFVKLLALIKRLKTRKSSVITHGDVVGAFVATGPSMKDVTLNRAHYLLKNKAKGADFSVLCQSLIKQNKAISTFAEFKEGVTPAGLDDDLVAEIAAAFYYGKKGKGAKVDVKAIVEAIARKWPDSKHHASRHHGQHKK